MLRVSGELGVGFEGVKILVKIGMFTKRKKEKLSINLKQELLGIFIKVAKSVTTQKHKTTKLMKDFMPWFMFEF